MEYYVVEKKNNLGEQYIELSVFQSITTHEMSKIEGVDFDGGKGAVNVEINDHNQVVIDLNNAIDRYIGFRNVKVNINVNKIKF